MHKLPFIYAYIMSGPQNHRTVCWKCFFSCSKTNVFLTARNFLMGLIKCV